MRVLIADDQKSVGTSLAEMVGLCHHHVAEVVSTGMEAIQAYDRHRPDVVLMDYRMPGLNGAEATAAVLAAAPATRVICLTASVTTEEVDEVLAAGAVACVTKDEDFDRLVAVVCEAGAA
jgi:DNA-binding NarL/FixJ family response regulator